MHQMKESLKDILKRIEHADDTEITEIIQAIMHWQGKRYPEYELVVVSLSKYDKEKRCQEIDLMADFLKSNRNV